MAKESFLSIWGSMVATAAITWNIISYLFDKGRLKVYATVVTKTPGDPDKYYLMISATNIGKIPITITSWGGVRKEKDKHFIVLSRDLPTKLGISDSFFRYTDNISDFIDTKSIHVIDSSGKFWKVKRKNYKKVIKNIKEIV